MDYPLLRVQGFVKYTMKSFSLLYDKFFPENRIYLKSSCDLYQEHQKINKDLGWKELDPISGDAGRVLMKDIMEDIKRMKVIEKHKDFDRAKVEQLKDSLHAVTAKLEGKLN